MYFCITGFLPDNADDSLKYELDVDSSFDEQILKLLGEKSLHSMPEGLLVLSQEQIAELSNIIGQNIPNELEILIGVEAY